MQAGNLYATYVDLCANKLHKTKIFVQQNLSLSYIYSPTELQPWNISYQIYVNQNTITNFSCFRVLCH